MKSETVLGNGRGTRSKARGYAALTVLAAALVACDDAPPATPGPAAAPPRAAEVHVLTLEPQNWVQTIRTFGVVEPIEEVVITTDFSATVEEILFAEGQAVEAGARLIEFDKRKRMLRLERAEAALNDARANLEQAQDLFQRRERLYANKNVSLEAFRKAETGLRTATAKMESALASRNLARQEVGEATLISPVSGVVVKRSVEVGETVLAGTPLAVIQANDAMRVVTYVTEKDVNALRLGAPAKLTTPAVPGHTYEARIDLIGFKADARTGNYPVKLTLSNEDGLLRDGMTARVVMQGLELAGVLVVPRAALVDRERRRVLYKLVEGRAVEVVPILAAATGEALPVLDGLEPGDQVIVSGLGSVSDGGPVTVIEDAGDGEDGGG